MVAATDLRTLFSHPSLQVLVYPLQVSSLFDIGYLMVASIVFWGLEWALSMVGERFDYVVDVLKSVFSSISTGACLPMPDTAFIHCVASLCVS